MPRSIGKDKSTLPRGQRSTRVGYGVKGEWLGLPVDVQIKDEVCNTFVLATEEKLHIMLVPKWCRDEVFQVLNSNWSWSKHLATRLLVDAVLLSPKPLIWHHGMVTPSSFKGELTGVEETHADRVDKLPSIFGSGGSKITVEDEELLFRL